METRTIEFVALGTKVAVAFASIFMARIERQILSQSCIKPLFWKRYIDDVFSLWNTSLDKIESFVKKANNFHSTIKFTAEMSETEIMFRFTWVFFGCVCAARDSKLAPRSKKKFP